MASTRWTDADLMAHQARMGRKSNDAPVEAQAAKPSKYRNVRTVVDGITFDSKREAQYWAELKIREQAGDIHQLRRQVSLPLLCPGRTKDAKPEEYTTFDPIQHVVSHYIADFVYVDNSGQPHVVDAKGKRTAMYQLKKKWLELQSGIVIEEV